MDDDTSVHHFISSVIPSSKSRRRRLIAVVAVVVILVSGVFIFSTSSTTSSPFNYFSTSTFSWVFPNSSNSTSASVTPTPPLQPSVSNATPPPTSPPPTRSPPSIPPPLISHYTLNPPPPPPTYPPPTQTYPPPPPTYPPPPPTYPPPPPTYPPPPPTYPPPPPTYPPPPSPHAWLDGECDLYDGVWVRDEGMPFYPPGSCPHIDGDFDCHKNGRPDDGFLKWRWKPYGCDIPRMNATDFLTRLRGQRLIFVGDSLNRNMWESLVCILRHSIKNKKRVYEVSGKSHFKTKGYYSFRFDDYQCNVDFVRSPFLVKELFYKNKNGSEDEKLRLDVLDETTTAYHKANIIVFNTGHWWTHEKTSKGVEYYQEGNYIYPTLKVMEAYKKALTTWSKWVDKNIDASKTQVVFRGYSLTHFKGGQWNSGGQCHKETEPIFNQTYLTKYPAKMTLFEEILKQMKTPVIYLNISRLTDYRKDGHPSIYRKQYKSVQEQIDAVKSQDCSHWCLPGIPDSWNELLYASLLMTGKGSWKR